MCDLKKRLDGRKKEVPDTPVRKGTGTTTTANIKLLHTIPYHSQPNNIRNTYLVPTYGIIHNDRINIYTYIITSETTRNKCPLCATIHGGA